MVSIPQSRQATRSVRFAHNRDGGESAGSVQQVVFLMARKRRQTYRAARASGEAACLAPRRREGQHWFVLSPSRQPGRRGVAGGDEACPVRQKWLHYRRPSAFSARPVPARSTRRTMRQRSAAGEVHLRLFHAVQQSDEIQLEHRSRGAGAVLFCDSGTARAGEEI